MNSMKAEKVDKGILFYILRIRPTVMLEFFLIEAIK